VPEPETASAVACEPVYYDRHATVRKRSALAQQYAVHHVNCTARTVFRRVKRDALCSSGLCSATNLQRVALRYAERVLHHSEGSAQQMLQNKRINALMRTRKRTRVKW